MRSRHRVESSTPILPLDGQTISLLLLKKTRHKWCSDRQPGIQNVNIEGAKQMCWMSFTRRISFALTAAQTRTNCNKDTREKYGAKCLTTDKVSKVLKMVVA
jgi:hypothetical protein